MEMLAIDSNLERHSKKKELLQGTVEFMMAPSFESDHTNGQKSKKEKHDMPIIVLTDNARFDAEPTNEEEKIKMDKMIKHMLSDLMHSNLMGSFNENTFPSALNGHKSDLVHGFENPLMKGITGINSPKFIEENLHSDSIEGNFFSNFATEEGASSVGGVPTEIPRSGSTEVGSATLNSAHSPEAQFTTLEVALGPAILPLQVTQR